MTNHLKDDIIQIIKCYDRDKYHWYSISESMGGWKPCIRANVNNTLEQQSESFLEKLLVGDAVFRTLQRTRVIAFA